jgi:hypothetical protein
VHVPQDVGLVFVDLERVDSYSFSRLAAQDLQSFAFRENVPPIEVHGGEDDGSVREHPL